MDSEDICLMFQFVFNRHQYHFVNYLAIHELTCQNNIKAKLL